MQDMTPDTCTNAPLGATKTLIDSRDNSTYTIAKLKNHTDYTENCWMTQNLAIINQTINSTNSDITSGNFTIPAPNISGFTGDDQNNPKAYYDAKYGGYYNWYTATAGTGNTSITTDGTNAPSSICPKGWRLPPNTGDNSYTALLNGLANGTALINSPFYFTYGGFVNNSLLNDAGSRGYYWSSTANSATSAYFLAFNSSGVNPSSSNYRFRGNSVRCVTR